MATHSSILAWRIPWTEHPGGLQSMGSQRVRREWNNLACTHACPGRREKREGNAVWWGNGDEPATLGMRDGKWVSSCLPAQSNGGGYLEHSAEKDSEAESVLSETRCEYQCLPQGQVWSSHTWAFVQVVSSMRWAVQESLERQVGATLWSSLNAMLRCSKHFVLLPPAACSVQLCDPVDCSRPDSSVHGISRQEYCSGPSCLPPGICYVSCTGTST